MRPVGDARPPFIPYLLTRGGFQAQEREDENASSVQTSEEETFNPPVFVNTRRGKANGTKRKISDTWTANECDVHGPPASAEVLDAFLCINSGFFPPCMDY